MALKAFAVCTVLVFSISVQVSLSIVQHPGVIRNHVIVHVVWNFYRLMKKKHLLSKQSLHRNTAKSALSGLCMGQLRLMST